MEKKQVVGKKQLDDPEVAWKTLLDEAQYHYEGLQSIVASMQLEPKGTEELLRTLNYVLNLARQNYKNLMHCYSLYNRMKENN